MTTYTELRKISLEFRRLSSNLLRSGLDDSDVALARLMKYIENTEFIHDSVHSVIDNVDYDFKECFIIDGDGWNEMNIPEDEAKHLKAQYDYMNYIMSSDKKCVRSEAMNYPHSSKKWSDIIQSFLDDAIKPMIDYINDAISAEMILIEGTMSKQPSTVYNNVYGTMNWSESGSITSSNTTIVNDTKELLEKIVSSLDVLNGIPSDEVESVKDDLELISEQMVSPSPKKSRLQKCVAGIKKFVSDFGMKLAVTLTAGAVTSTDWQQLIEQLEKWIATLS